MSKAQLNPNRSTQLVRLATVEAQLVAHKKFCAEFRADQKHLNNQILADLKELRRTVYMLVGALAALEIGLSFFI